MAHYLFLSTGIVSHANAYSALAEWLQKGGHKVTFLCIRDDAQEHLQARDFEVEVLEHEAGHLKRHWAPIRPFSSHRLLGKLYGFPGFGKLMALLAWPSQWRRARRHAQFILHNDEFTKRLNDLEPDVLLTNPEMPHHILRTLARDIPVVLLETHVSTRYAPNVPRLDSSRFPGKSPRDRKRSEATWTRNARARRRRALVSRLVMRGQGEEQALRELAENLGLSFDQLVRVHDGWHPFEFPRLPVLELTARELDFPRPREPDRLILGPQVAVGREEPVAKQEEVKAEVFPSHQPLILCVMGSFGSSRSPDFLRKVVDAARQSPQWNWVMGLGDMDPSPLGPLPPNMRALSELSQLRWLKKADVMITHGGIATINECVLARVPMVIFSNGFLDRDGNAARVEWHGLGVRGDLNRDQAQDIVGHLERVLGDASFGTALESMAKHFEAYQRPAHQSAVWKALERRLDQDQLR